MRKTEPVTHFPQAAEDYCADCITEDRTAIKLGTSSVYTLQYIMSKEVEKLYTFKVSSKCRTSSKAVPVDISGIILIMNLSQMN